MRKVFFVLMLVFLIMASGCASQTPILNPATPIPSVDATQATPIPTVSPSPEPTETVGEVPGKNEINELLTDFMSPLVRVHESIPAGTQPSEDEMFSIVRAAIYDTIDKYFWGQEYVGPRIESRYDYEKYEAYVLVETFVQAAKDYLLWEISGAQVRDYYKTLYGGAYNLVTPDDEIVFSFGEGDIHQNPFITSCVAERDTYRLTLCNAILDQPFIMPDRTAEAIIRKNSDSMFGYTLLSYQDELAISGTSSSATKSGYPLENALDGLHETAWVPEEPTGCWVELRFSRPIKVDSIELYGGYMKSPELLEKNNRVRVLQAEFSDGTVYVLQVDDMLERGINSTAQTLILPEPCVTDFTKLTVLEVYPGSMYDDTCISELSMRPYSLFYDGR